MQTKAIVFDFDGLLMDTETTLWQCWQYEWRRHGLELDPATFFADHGGDASAERCRRLAAAVGPGFDYEASRARRKAYREQLHERLGLRDGIDAWLAQAREAGLRCAVASSSPREWVTGELRRIDRLEDFSVLAYGDEVSAHKPAPDVYLLALERLGLDPAQAVAVEDTPHGVAAAKAAGLACIAIPNPFAEASRFTAADLLLTSAADVTLPAALDTLESRSRAASAVVTPSAANGVTGIAAQYRDPLWGIEVALTSVEQALLRTWPLRRLHLIAHAGAAAITTTQTYSRLEHSLGVLALAAHFRPEDEELRAAALLHDIGHLPFSHTFEGISGLNHHARGISLLSEQAVRVALEAHGLSPQTILALLDGKTASPLTPPPGLLGLDHLDSYVRSARFAARLEPAPASLLAGIDIQDNAVNCERSTAETLVELVCAEARMHVSWDNVAPSAALQRLVRRLLDAGHADPDQLARMTDAQLWAALDAAAETRDETELLRTQPHLLRTRQAETDMPAAPPEWDFALRKIYRSAPLVNGQRVEAAAPDLASKLDDLQKLAIKYRARWDAAP